MCSGDGNDSLLPLGFPIRKSTDQSLVGSSPRLIAASYVLLRLLVPRHPPCALTNLVTKMLASTVQFSRYGRDPILDSPRARSERVVRRGPALRPPVQLGTGTRGSIRSLRTQQRASANHSPPCPGPRCSRSSTGDRNRLVRLMVSDPPLSTPPRDSCPRSGFGTGYPVLNAP